MEVIGGFMKVFLVEQQGGKVNKNEIQKNYREGGSQREEVDFRDFFDNRIYGIVRVNGKFLGEGRG